MTLPNRTQILEAMVEARYPLLFSGTFNEYSRRYDNHTEELRKLHQAEVLDEVGGMLDAALPLIQEAVVNRIEGGPWEYGRRDRVSGRVYPLAGPPFPDWWGESQEKFVHVRRPAVEWQEMQE